MPPPLRIILVRPGGAANVGATCRAMANFGLSDLVVVAPRCDLRDPRALAYAAHAAPLLQAARAAETLPQALAGCVRSFATTSKTGTCRRQALSARAAAPAALQAAAHGPVAFAFGPENHGLTTAELLDFDRVVTIPAEPAYPVLNLAAAVTVVCYELRLAHLAADQPPAPLRQAARDETKRVLFAKLFDALELIGFFGGQQNPDHLKHALRHLLGRLDLTASEADILIGLASQIRWYAQRHRRPDPVAL